ncbi:MAG: hypothetical protein AAFQ66_11720 [Pseudomonadota bacterium]
MLQNEKIVAELVGLEPLKTWSLIVTLFGDYEGDSLSGKQLRAFLEPLGIRPEAIRVALHRLKKNGWIDFEKSGREVIYRLSAHGRTETDAVYQDVYCEDLKHPFGWRVLLSEEASDVGSVGPMIKIGRQITLLPREETRVDPNELEVSFARSDLPIWFQHRIVPERLLTLAENVDRVAAALPEPAQLDEPWHLRLLLLHHWRKMALRQACWAHIHFVPDGAIARCHKRITHFLGHTPHLQESQTTVQTP